MFETVLEHFGYTIMSILSCANHTRAATSAVPPKAGHFPLLRMRVYFAFTNEAALAWQRFASILATLTIHRSQVVLPDRFT